MSSAYSWRDHNDGAFSMSDQTLTRSPGDSSIPLNDSNKTNDISNNDNDNSLGNMDFGMDDRVMEELGLQPDGTTAKRRIIRPKLDEDRLLDQKYGLTFVRENATKRIKLRGKGHEREDLTRILNFYQLWAHRLFPRAKFDDFIPMARKTGKKSRIKQLRNNWIEEEQLLKFRESLAKEKELEEEQQQNDNNLVVTSNEKTPNENENRSDGITSTTSAGPTQSRSQILRSTDIGNNPNNSEDEDSIFVTQPSDSIASRVRNEDEEEDEDSLFVGGYHNRNNNTRGRKRIMDEDEDEDEDGGYGDNTSIGTKTNDTNNYLLSSDKSTQSKDSQKESTSNSSSLESPTSQIRHPKRRIIDDEEETENHDVAEEKNENHDIDSLSKESSEPKINSNEDGNEDGTGDTTDSHEDNDNDNNNNTNNDSDNDNNSGNNIDAFEIDEDFDDFD